MNKHQNEIVNLIDQSFNNKCFLNDNLIPYYSRISVISIGIGQGKTNIIIDFIERQLKYKESKKINDFDLDNVNSILTYKNGWNMSGNIKDVLSITNYFKSDYKNQINKSIVYDVFSKCFIKVYQKKKFYIIVPQLIYSQWKNELLNTGLNVAYQENKKKNVFLYDDVSFVKFRKNLKSLEEIIDSTIILDDYHNYINTNDDLIKLIEGDFIDNKIKLMFVTNLLFSSSHTENFASRKNSYFYCEKEHRNSICFINIKYLINPNPIKETTLYFDSFTTFLDVDIKKIINELESFNNKRKLEECIICLDIGEKTHVLNCCKKVICFGCLNEYIRKSDFKYQYVCAHCRQELTAGLKKSLILCEKREEITINSCIQNLIKDYKKIIITRTQDFDLDTSYIDILLQTNEDMITISNKLDDFRANNQKVCYLQIDYFNYGLNLNFVDLLILIGYFEDEYRLTLKCNKFRDNKLNFFRILPKYTSK